MNRSGEPLSWPDAARWRAWLVFQGVFLLFFIPVYFGAGYLASQSARAASPAFSFETEIPLLPWTIILYQSIFQLFLLPLFQLTAPQMAVLTRQSILILLVAGAAFLIAPTQLSFERHEVTGLFAPIYALLHAVDAVYNCAPSLHVAFAALILLACRDRATQTLARLYIFWLTSLALSTLTTHQHHVIDVVTGLLLALAARRLIPSNAPPAQ